MRSATTSYMQDYMWQHAMRRTVPRGRTGSSTSSRAPDKATRLSLSAELTPRELDVLALVATGKGNHEIARRLVLWEKTIRNHVAAILVKLQVPNRPAAVANARDAGIGQND